VTGPSSGADPVASAVTPLPLPPVLLVEDDPVHAELVPALLRVARMANPMITAVDGDQAVRVLSEQAAADALPALVLLDVHLPGRSGIDVLAWMRDHERLAEVPVVMLTAAADMGVIRRAYDLGIASYLVKPVGVDAIAAMVRDLSIPWALLCPPRRG
jgi:response regulator of citrate/malate metabolism